MATVINTRDVLLLGSATRILSVTLPSNISVPSNKVTGLGDLASKNTVSQIDFTSGLEPVTIVTSLPSVTGYTGTKMVFLTTDGQLYRYVSGAWTKAVPAVNITGQLSDSQLADISAAKLTGQITATQITDGAISTPKLAAGSITTAKIAAGAITASEIATGTITATQLAAGSVTAGKIAAGAITSNEIAANTITAGMISAGAISADKIAANTITAAKIVAGTITANEIAANTITADKISASYVYAGTISGNQISGGTMSGVYVNGYSLNIITTFAAPLLSVSAGGISFGNYASVSFAKDVSISNAGTGISLATGSYAAAAGSGDGQIYAADGFIPFTGGHKAFIVKDTFFEIGDIVYDKQVLVKHDISNTLTEVALTNKANNKAVVGVIASLDEENTTNELDVDEDLWYNYCQDFSLITMNSVGEGMLNVCGENGDIEAGDLICSSNTVGKGMKQSDDIVRNITVAKSRENVKFSSKDEVKQIACIYMCG